MMAVLMSTLTMTPMVTLMLNKPSRRSALMGMISSLALAAVATPGAAMNAAGAKKLVDSIVADINKVIAAPSSEAQKIKQFEKIFVRYSDVPTIARYALGVDARRASKAQMANFTRAFQSYVSKKYGKRFREFIGGKIEVKDAKKVKSFFEVKTIARLRGEAPFEVTFLISDRSGKSKFFNIFIEGVNMLLTERTEIGSMLDKRRGDIDALIRDLKTAG